jgi:pimeloyl-ACP methyl ester carboxylesterase
LTSVPGAHVARAPGTLVKRWIEQPLVLASQRWLPRESALRVARAARDHGAWVYDPRCDDAVLEFVRFAIAHLPLADVAALLGMLRSEDTRAGLARIGCPTLVVTGTREAGWIWRSAVELAGAIPHATRVALEGVGHLHPLSAPERLVAAIAHWRDDRRAPIAGG